MAVQSTLNDPGVARVISLVLSYSHSYFQVNTNQVTILSYKWDDQNVHLKDTENLIPFSPSAAL